MQKAPLLHLILLANLFCQNTAAGIAAPSEPNAILAAETTRSNAVYALGEKAGFRVFLKGTESPPTESIPYTLSLDGAAIISRGTLSLSNGSASVEGTLIRPGALRLTVGPVPKWGHALACAIFAPFRIEPTARHPSDFEAFWQAQRVELGAIPMDAKLEALVVSNEAVEAWDVSLANIKGLRVHAYVGKPKGAVPVPALITLPGAGIRSASLESVVTWAARGFLVLDLNIHDLPNGQPPEFYKAAASNGLITYPGQGREDRGKYYYRQVILGALRAVDFMASRPEWNRKVLIASGASQGGGLALILGGLDGRVTAVAANVPALCEHSGVAFGRPVGFPRLVPAPEGKFDAAVLEVSGYYDAVNFAPRVQVPVVMSVGLIDTTCPPMTCLSAYNVIPSTKSIDLAPLRGHSGSASFPAMRDDFIREQAGVVFK